MVASVTNSDPVYSEPPVEESLTLLKTARVGESLLLLFSAVGLCTFAGLFFASSPLPLFLAGALLPIATCLAVIFNDPYYEDPLKRELYREEIRDIGLEAFIQKHGWEQLERYGFCFSGSSPLITKEGYTEAFFDAPRSIESPLLWRGLEHDLFLKGSLDRLADLLISDVQLLLRDGRFWKAESHGVFALRKEQVSAEISKYLRHAAGYDILALWTRLEKADLVPLAFPLASWAKQSCAKVEAFELQAKIQKEELRKDYLETKAGLRENADRKRAEILLEKEPDMHELRAVAEEFEKTLEWLEQNHRENIEHIISKENELRAEVRADFEGAKAQFGLYFTFDEHTLYELIEMFGLPAIELSRAEFGFPSPVDWSDKFIEETEPPLWISLEKGLLDARGEARAERMILEQLESPWDIAEKSLALRAFDAGLFKEKAPLLRLLGAIEPLRDPIRILKCYSALSRRSLVPIEWDVYPWLKELGPQFESRRKYFEAGNDDPFLQMQQERWHREVLEKIYHVEDQTKFQSDLELMPLKEFALRYGWDCITQLCLDAFASRFFSEYPHSKEQLASGLVWPLVEGGCFDQKQKAALEKELLDNVVKGLIRGDIQQALGLGLFTDRSALRSAIDKLDPKSDRDVLVQVWPWLKGNGLIGDFLREITHWFDLAARGHVDQNGFGKAYSIYLAERDWKEKSLANWAKLYGKEALLKRMMQERTLMDRWEREDPLWSSDHLNWTFFERGLLSDSHVHRWMTAWIKRHPTFREKILSPDFAKAFRLSLFSNDDLRVIAASFHHPSTFLFAKDLIKGLDWIADLQIAFSAEEKLLYNWAKVHRMCTPSEALEREFAAYKKQIGWKFDSGFGFDTESKSIEVEEGEGLLDKVFRKK